MKIDGFADIRLPRDITPGEKCTIICHPFYDRLSSRLCDRANETILKNKHCNVKNWGRFYQHINASKNTQSLLQAYREWAMETLLIDLANKNRPAILCIPTSQDKKGGLHITNADPGSFNYEFLQKIFGMPNVFIAPTLSQEGVLTGDTTREKNFLYKAEARKIWGNFAFYPWKELHFGGGYVDRCLFVLFQYFIRHKAQKIFLEPVCASKGGDGGILKPEHSYQDIQLSGPSNTSNRSLYSLARRILTEKNDTDHVQRLFRMLYAEDQRRNKEGRTSIIKKMILASMETSNMPLSERRRSIKQFGIVEFGNIFQD